MYIGVGTLVLIVIIVLAHVPRRHCPRQQHERLPSDRP